MKKLILITLLFCSAFTIKAQNLILNGSFEQNSVTGLDCQFEIANVDYTALMHHSTAFSVYGGENSIFFEGCSTYTSIVPVGIAYDVDFSVMVFSADTIFNNFHYEKWTAFSLQLGQALQTGSYYKLNYYQRKIPHIYPPTYFSSGNLLLGISESDTAFGTVIDTIAYNNTEWENIEFIFKATIKGMLEQGLHAALVDDFVLTLDSMPPNAINEQQGKKQLLKIVDIFGRESKSKKGLLFYIYSDGTVEKKLIME